MKVMHYHYDMGSCDIYCVNPRNSALHRLILIRRIMAGEATTAHTWDGRVSYAVRNRYAVPGNYLTYYIATIS